MNLFKGLDFKNLNNIGEYWTKYEGDFKVD